MATEEAPHQLLPKTLALPVFSSDPLSSVAYATEEIMHVLLLAGTASLVLVTPVSFAIAALLLIVVVSYRQTVRAYPSGGGAYIVSRENLGEKPGLIAAAALLVDYVLTVSVSIVAGTDAITSAVPSLAQHRVLLASGFVALIMLANLRGVKESGVLFAIPTYTFVVSVFIMIGTGIVRCLADCPRAPVDPGLAEHLAHASQPLAVFLILRAFSSGSTALTGVEAISNGVPAFRRPQARNAATTLGVMGAISISMFLGISALARLTHAVPIGAEEAAELGIHHQTVIAQIGRSVFGGGFLFYFLQTTTAMILILAANTAYQDFPRLASILARDRYMPRQFMNRGDRLVFSNGVLVLTALAIALIVIFGASTSRLIQLYVIGVFTSFTLSQSGMVVHWLRDRRERAWRRSIVINAVGAVVTGLVLVVTTLTKFTHGAYLVVIAIPLIVLLFRGIHRHYASVHHQLRKPGWKPVPIVGTHVLIPVAQIDEATLRSLGYAKALRPISIHAVHVAPGGDAAEMAEAWGLWQMGVALDVLPGEDLVASVRGYVRGIERRPGAVVTVLIPETLRGRGWWQFLRRRKALLLKTAMLFEPGVVVTDAPVPAGRNRLPGHRPVAPPRNEAVVLVSAVHDASLRAVAYATAIRPTGLRAVTFNVDPVETERVMAEWVDNRVNALLEVLDSPYREVRRPLLAYVRRIKAAAPGTVVTIVIPEFVVRKWRHQFLHNQTALGIKAAMLFEPDVVVTSVPYLLD